MYGAYAVWLWGQIAFKHGLGPLFLEFPRRDPMPTCPCGWCQASVEYLNAIRQLGKESTHD
jgi:hypothetical protein